MEDIKIIELFFNRAESAIEEADRKYGAFLNQIAYNILSNSADSEEVVNDTYWGAWNAIPPQRPRVLKHFLSRITRNLAFKRLEYFSAAKRSHNAEVMLSELEECIPDRKINIDSLIEGKIIRRAINRYLGSISKDDCALFVSRYFYVQSVSELSKRYSLSERQVKYRLSKMCSQLKEILEKEEVYV